LPLVGADRGQGDPFAETRFSVDGSAIFGDHQGVVLSLIGSPDLTKALKLAGFGVFPISAFRCG
jgi:hypothetical protein